MTLSSGVALLWFALASVKLCCIYDSGMARLTKILPILCFGLSCIHAGTGMHRTILKACSSLEDPAHSQQVFSKCSWKPCEVMGSKHSPTELFQ